MSLRVKYILFIGVLHALLCVLSYHLFDENRVYFLLAELGILLSLYLSYLLYKAMIRPIEYMLGGTDAIKDGDFTIKYLETGSTEMDKLIRVYNLMIDRLREERVNSEEKTQFVHRLIDSSPMGIILTDYDGRISEYNNAASELLDLQDDDIGQKLAESSTTILSSLAKLEIGHSEILTSDGVIKYKCQVGQAVHQGFMRRFYLIDNMSVELLRSEKEAYGKVIRMMAHEVNNSMGAINSILDTVSDFALADEDDKDYRDSLLIAKERNEGLSKFMSNYASILRLPEPTMTKIDMSVELRKAAQLYSSRAAARAIDFDYELSESCMVHADPVLLAQAFSNIIKNAIESIGADGRMRFVLKADPMQIIISDNGKGISSEAAKNIFKPFFSTKPEGQGVGLMVIREVMQAHDYQFSLKTDHTTGWTHFRISES